MTKKLSSPEYGRLVADIQGIYAGAQESAAQAVSRILVSAYWRIGRRIVEVEQGGAGRAAYGTGLLKRLSRDLTEKCGQGFSERNLRNFRRFYSAFPKWQNSAGLRWSHYQLLSTLARREDRRRLEKEAAEGGWSLEELRDAIISEKLPRLFTSRKREGETYEGTLRARRGVLYTYRVLSASGGSLTLDLGFNVRRDVAFTAAQGSAGDSAAASAAGDSAPVVVAAGQFVASVKSGGNYSFAPSPAEGGAQYTYAAAVEKIVDGDTLWVVADLGFRVTLRVKLRLHALDAAEIDTKKGVRAKEFLEGKLAGCEKIVVRTFGTDKYARYLADVYYLPGESDEQRICKEGNFLNSELIQEGLARKV